MLLHFSSICSFINVKATYRDSEKTVDKIGKQQQQHHSAHETVVVNHQPEMPAKRCHHIAEQVVHSLLQNINLEAYVYHNE